jgi:hypothetical protein
MSTPAYRAITPAPDRLLREQSRPEPPPAKQPAGPGRAVVSAMLLPFDAVVALHTVVQQLPHLIHDLRGLVRSLTHYVDELPRE